MGAAGNRGRAALIAPGGVACGVISGVPIDGLAARNSQDA
jgi:hypothetical protein